MKAISRSMYMTNNPVSTVNALVDSLWRDPFYIAITADFANDEAKRRDALVSYFDYSMTEGARIGRCVLAPDVALGAAVWLLPIEPALQATETIAKSKHLAGALGPKGANNYQRIIEFMGPRAQTVVSDSAWYLSIIGISPSAQGMGIGAHLVKPTLAEANHCRAACYLETFTPRNLHFYERLGFKVLAAHKEPVTDAEYVIMHRDVQH